MHTHNYDYTITLAGDPEFNSEQKANRGGWACLEKSGTCLGILDLCQLPEEFILHHGKLETIDETGGRKIARLTIEEPGKIKFNSTTLKLSQL